MGAGAWKEINRGTKGDNNYWWNEYEGPEADPRYVDPIFAYGHDGDPATTGCSITGDACYNPATV